MKSGPTFEGLNDKTSADKRTHQRRSDARLSYAAVCASNDDAGNEIHNPPPARGLICIGMPHVSRYTASAARAIC